MHDSFSEGSVYYGRTIAIVGVVMALAILLNMI